jgi:hypothetical protein
MGIVGLFERPNSSGWRLPPRVFLLMAKLLGGHTREVPEPRELVDPLAHATDFAAGISALRAWPGFSAFENAPQFPDNL